MSYWISLHDEQGNMPQVSGFEEGGTYCVGGSTEADLNVTYNYSKHFNFRDLHKQKAQDTIRLLADAVRELGTERDEDYWEPSPGNAGYACAVLLGWAKTHPACTWEVH